MMNRLFLAAALASALLLQGCGYNTLQRTDEQIKAAWAEVINQYQRRADLIPNLVNTVAGFAAQEQQVLLGVTNARAKVGTIQARQKRTSGSCRWRHTHGIARAAGRQKGQKASQKVAR